MFETQNTAAAIYMSFSSDCKSLLQIWHASKLSRFKGQIRGNFDFCKIFFQMINPGLTQTSFWKALFAIFGNLFCSSWLPRVGLLPWWDSLAAYDSRFWSIVVNCELFAIESFRLRVCDFFAICIFIIGLWRVLKGSPAVSRSWELAPSTGA